MEPAQDENYDTLNPLRPDAVQVTGITRRGKPCALVDNTGAALPRAELAALLDALIAADRFGFTLSSAGGGSALALDRREFAHVQIAGQLFRLILHRYEARLEPF